MLFISQHIMDILKIQTQNPPFPDISKTRPTHQRTDANLYPPERQLTKASEPSFDLEGGAKGQL